VVPALVAIAGTDADAADADADDHAVYMMDLFVDNLERSSHVKAVGAVADDGDGDKVLSAKNKKIMSVFHFFPFLYILPFVVEDRVDSSTNVA
jgi:hypothetical protein